LSRWQRWSLQREAQPRIALPATLKHVAQSFAGWRWRYGWVTDVAIAQCGAGLEGRPQHHYIEAWIDVEYTDHLGAATYSVGDCAASMR
jgi:hypothetical protein